MKSKLIPQTKLSGITLTTVLIIVFSFILFFFVSVRNKESRITERGFRILNQYVTNLSSRLINYEKIAKNARNIDCVKNKVFNIDSIMGYENNLKPKELLEFGYNSKKNKLRNKNELNQNNIKDTTNERKSNRLKYFVSVSNLVNDIFGDDIFSDYVLIKNDEVLYKTIDIKFELNNFKEFSQKALKENNTTESFFSQKPDTSLNSGKYFKSGYIADVSIAQTKYKLFVFPLLPSPGKENEEWFIGGLVKAKDFIKAKRSVQSWIVILIMLFFIAVIFSFPIVKLFIIKAIERIQRSNLYYAGVALIFGIAILNIFFLNQLTGEYLGNNSENQIKYLNDTIKKSFESEIYQAYNTLKYLDKDTDLINTQNNIFDTCYFNKETISKNCLVSQQIKDQDTSFYKFFKTVFWTDSSGQQVMELLTWPESNNLVNLASRDYFKNPGKWMLPFSDPEDNCLFTLQSIYSITSGAALVALSTASTKKDIIYKTKKKDTAQENKNESETYKIDTVESKVGAIISPMYSIIETILPMGFQFQIIDSGGEVLFHSNKSKNLQENLFVESNYNKDLISLVNERNEDNFEIDLYNKSYNAYLSPLNNLPLYLVTLESNDENFHQNAQITLTLLIYLIAILITGILVVFVLVIIASQKKGLYNRSFVLDWCLPRSKNLEYYNTLTIANIFQILILVVLTVFVKHYYIEQSANALFFAITIFIINMLFAYSLLEVRSRKFNELIKKPIIVWSFVILFILSVWYSIIHPEYLLYMGVILFGIFIFGIYKTPIKFNNLLIKKGSNNYLKAYRYYFLTLLILSSIVIPSYVYKSFFVETSQNKLKRQQFYTVQQLEKRDLGIDAYFNRHLCTDDSLTNVIKSNKKKKGIYAYAYLDTDSKKSIINRDIKKKGTYGFLYFDSVSRNLMADCDTLKNPNWFNPYSKISLLITKRNNYILDLTQNKASDDYWNWIIIKNNNKFFKEKELVFSSKIKTKDSDKNNFKTCYIQSKLPVKSPLWIGGWKLLLKYVAAILICIFLLNLLLTKLLNKIFFSDKFNIDKRYKLEEAIDKIKKIKRNGIFVNNLDYDEIKRQLTIKTIEKSTDKIHYHIVNNVEDIDNIKVNENDIYLYFGLSDNKYKLKKEINQILTFEEKFNTTIIILLNNTPNNIIDKYQSQNNNEITEENPAIATQLKTFFARYIVLYISEDIIKNETSEIKNEIIRKELSVSNYLFGFKTMLLDFEEDNIKKIKAHYPKCEKDEELLNIMHPKQCNDSYIIAIKDLANTYYQQIWDACTIEEQFILFDLADDSIANCLNRDELKELIGKGLIDNKNGLELMNESFAYFILDNSNKNKLINMELEAKRKGGWNKFKLPLILIGLSIGVFIITTQQNLVSNLYGVLISVGGIIGVASRFNVMFKGGAGK
ncbi:MAG: hypothetical protein GQ564_23635 [Bacteroidales bacterium]|nr:hypothetical protein [Bacteroidales bacterium]